MGNGIPSSVDGRKTGYFASLAVSRMRLGLNAFQRLGALAVGLSMLFVNQEEDWRGKLFQDKATRLVDLIPGQGSNEVREVGLVSEILGNSIRS